MSETTPAKLTKLQTLDAKITAGEAALTKLREERNKLAAEETQAVEQAAARKQIEVDGLDEFTKVRFTFGRKDNRKDYTGEVVAFRPASGDLPAAYRIETGTGFDLQVLTVPARDVQPIAPVAVEDAAEVAAA